MFLSRAIYSLHVVVKQWVEWRKIVILPGPILSDNLSRIKLYKENGKSKDKTPRIVVFRIFNYQFSTNYLLSCGWATTISRFII